MNSTFSSSLCVRVCFRRAAVEPGHWASPLLRLSSSAVTSPLRKPRLHLPHSQTNTRRTPSPRPDRRSSWHGGARNTRLRVWLRFPLPLVAHLHSVALSHSPVLIVAIARAPVHLSISLALMGQRERRRNFVILERKVRELSCSK